MKFSRLIRNFTLSRPVSGPISHLLFQLNPDLRNLRAIHGMKPDAEGEKTKW